MFKEILLPIDLNHPESWKTSLPIALEHHKAFGARLHIMTVLPDFGMSIVGQYFPKDFEKKALAETNKKLHAFVSDNVPSGVDVQHIVAHGTIYKEILHAAEQIKADLIIMASHRPELSDYLIGPNAARVVRHADVSVMVVRG